jgi:hypothetical protein
VHSPIFQLAQQTLRHPEIEFPPVPDRVMRVVSASGVGLDLEEGEIPLALSPHANRDELSHFVFLTDRRLVGKSSEGLVHVPFAELQGVHPEPSMLLSTLNVAMRGQWSKLIVSSARLSHIAQFLTGVTQMPPAYRNAGPDPLVVPAPDDPGGTRRALTTMRGQDDRAKFLYWLIEQGGSRGWLPLEAARDLTARVTLLHRASVSGRAMRDTWWLSVLPVQMLASLFEAYFGTPIARMQNGPLLTVDFAQKSSSGNAAAVASSVVGIAALAFLGVGWVSRPTGEGFDGFRFVITEINGRGAFTIAVVKNRQFIPISNIAPRTLAAISRTLIDSEARLTLHRIMCTMNVAGYTPPPPTRDALTTAVAHLFGPTDLTRFFTVPK